jgi:hypothetical protein
MANDWFKPVAAPTGVAPNEIAVIPSDQSATYAIYDQTRVIQLSFAAEDVAAGTRSGDDLILTLTNGETVRIVDYFADSDGVPVLDFVGGGVLGMEDILALLSFASLGAYAIGSGTDPLMPRVTSFGPLGLTGTGEPGSTILLLDRNGNPMLDAAGQRISTTVLANGTWAIPAADFPNGSTANFKGGIVAIDADGNRSNEIELPITDINGNVVAGPIVAGHGLVVDLYDGDGNLILADVELDADGQFSVTLAGSYNVIVAVLRDENAAPDYRDETSGAPVDVTSTMMALALGAPDGPNRTFVQLNINPATTIAAQVAGIAPDGTFPPDGISAALVTQSNDAVADALGLPSLQGITPVNIFDDDFDDTDGNITDGESYGQVLAMLSGLDQLNSGNQEKTIADMAAIIAGGAPAADILEDVRDALLDGAAEYEFNNPGNTQNLADLLRAPALNVDNTPPVDNSGASTLPQVTNLLTDAVNGTSMNSGRNDALDSIASFQNLVNTVGAVQQLASLQVGSPVEQAVVSQLTEANFTALGLTGQTAPSPFLEPFLDAIMAASNDGLATDTVAELQALLDATIAAVSTPTIVTTENANGTINVSGRAAPLAVVTIVFPDGTSATATAGADGAYGPVTSATPQPEGTIEATAENVNGDEFGNTAPYDDTTAPSAPTVVAGAGNADGTLTVTGTGEPGATVSVTMPSGETVTATVAANGSYSATSSTVQPEGTVTAVQTDRNGNGPSPSASAPYDDTTAPSAPTVVAGAGNADGTLTVTGTGEPGATVSVTMPSGETVTATVAANGSYSATSSTVQPEGTVTAVQTDRNGNGPSPSASAAYDDSTAPSAPTVVAGAGNADGTLTVTGTGEPGATISVTMPSGETVTATVAANGSYSATSSTVQPEGTVTAVQTDRNGNGPSPSASAAYDDSTAPSAPTVVAGAGNADGTLTVTGTGEPGATISVTMPSGETVTATVAANGSYSATSSTVQPEGTVTAVQTDRNGNGPSPSVSAAYDDSTAPSAPTVVAGAGNADGTLTVTGTGEPGATVSVTMPSGETVTATVAANGSYSATSSTVQPEGTVTAVQTDRNGNGPSPSVSAAYDDTTAPAAPTVVAGAGNADGTLTVTGTGEPGATISVTMPSGETVTATVAANGSYSATSSTVQPEGTVTAVQTDRNGNGPSPSASAAYDDSTAPAAPTVVAGAGNADGTLTVTGTGEPGATVSVTMPSGETVTATVAANGSYSATSSTVQPEGTVTAVQTDRNGNGPSPSASAPYDDTTAPSLPLASSTMNAATGVITTTGTAEPGSVVTVTFPSGATATATADAVTGAFSITSPAGQPSGNVVTTARDAAGNTSPADTDAITDNNPPAAPVASSTMNAATGVITTTGTAEPGSVVTVTFPSGATATAVAAANGSFSITSPAGQPSGNVVTTARDAAGNTSPADTDAITDNNPPAAPVASSTMNAATGVITTTGTAEPGSVVTVTFPSGATATATADAVTGAFSITSPAGQPSGNVVTTARDAAGNTSPADTDAITDNNPPAAPVASSTMNAATGVITTTGTAEPGSVVTVTFPSGATATATANAVTGAFSITSPAGQPSGNVVTTARDAAGNTSPADTDAITDNNPPAAPVASSTMNAATGVITTTGTAEPGSVVTVTFPSGATATATANAVTGAFSITSPAGQPSGNVVTTARDAAGNTSPADTDAIVENVPPSAPTINAGITDQANTVSGTGEPGATVTLFNGATQIGTATVAPDGTWSLVTAAPVANGAVLTARQTDTAGNQGPLSSGVTTFTDTDGDGTANSTDTDDDGDGIADTVEQPAPVVVTENFNGLTQNAEVTSTGTAWVFATVSDTDGGGGLANSFYAENGSLQFFRNPAQQTLTQNFAGMSGGSTINVSMAIRSELTGNAVIQIEYAGIVYATIDTNSPNAVVFSNGATGSWAGSPNITTFGNLVVNLPTNVTPSGAAVIRYTTTQFSADDVAITSIQVTTPTTSFNADANGDQIDGSDGINDWIDAGAGNDTVTYGAGNDTVYGGAGNDLIADPFGSGNDMLYGASGQDTIRDASGSDSVFGGTGNDLLDLTGGGNDLLDGGAGNDTMYGGLGDDTIYLSPGDVIYGGDGSDRIIVDRRQLDANGATTSNMTVDGGLGSDTLDLRNIGNYTITQSGGNGTATILNELNITTGQTITFTGIETILGTPFSAPATGTIVDGTAGNDNMSLVYVDAGGQRIDGTDGPGGGPADWILAGAGNDTINYGAGNDTVFGGNGDDSFDDAPGIQNNGNNLLYGGAGNDIFLDSQGNDSVYGGAGNDSLVMDSGGQDFLDGGDGNDTLRGVFGADTIIIGSGDVATDQGGDDLFIVDRTQRDANGLFVANMSADGGSGNDTLDLRYAGNLTLTATNATSGTVTFLDANGNTTGVTLTYSNMENILGAPVANPSNAVNGTAGDDDMTRREVADMDGDGIINSQDRDSDGDRVWDKYEPTTDTDLDGLRDFLDTDSNGATPGTDTSLNSLSAAQITALQGGGTYSNQFILLSDNNVTLDFTQISNSAFSNVEYIDMRGGANAQTVTLTLSDVLAMTNAQRTLIIAGDAVDTVNAQGFVDTHKQRSIDGQIFDVYALNDATLLVDADVNVNTV